MMSWWVWVVVGVVGVIVAIIIFIFGVWVGVFYTDDDLLSELKAVDAFLRLGLPTKARERLLNVMRDFFQYDYYGGRGKEGDQ